MEYDVFISHASEDKQSVARPLAQILYSKGIRVWLDEFELTLGDSLRRQIELGLSRSQFGIVILSPAFFQKEWPNKELDALFARENGQGKVILPIWHNITLDEVLRYSPILADKLAVSTALGLNHVAEQIINATSSRPNPLVRLSRSDKYVQEHDALATLRIRLLAAETIRELFAGKYAVEAYLAEHPRSSEARTLKDDYENAIKVAEQRRSLGLACERNGNLYYSSGGGGLYWWQWLLFILILGGLLYVLWLGLRLLLSALGML